MKSFYKEWLRKSNEENSAIASSTATESKTPAQASSTLPQALEINNKPSTSRQAQQINDNPSSGIQLDTSNSNLQPASDSDLTKDILFENNELQLLIEKAAFQRQKRFRFQDHLFHVKIKLKEPKNTVPFLKDILDFLHDGLLHLMSKIKKYYNEKDNNICYLTLHQTPMVIGLNSGYNTNISCFFRLTI